MRLDTKKIKKEMKKRKWGYADLARQMGVSRQAAWEYLNHEKGHNFTLKTVTKIAKALKMKPKDILS